MHGGGGTINSTGTDVDRREIGVSLPCRYNNCAILSHFVTHSALLVPLILDVLLESPCVSSSAGSFHCGADFGISQQLEFREKKQCNAAQQQTQEA